MTKSLTEQWEDGTLEHNYYYLKLDNGDIEIQDNFIGGFLMSEQNRIIEVLAPVLSYEEYKELTQKVECLEKQVGIALTVLGQIARFSKERTDAVQAASAICEIATEIEEVK